MFLFKNRCRNNKKRCYCWLHISNFKFGPKFVHPVPFPFSFSGRLCFQNLCACFQHCSLLVLMILNLPPPPDCDVRGQPGQADPHSLTFPCLRDQSICPAKLANLPGEISKFARRRVPISGRPIGFLRCTETGVFSQCLRQNCPTPPF